MAPRASIIIIGASHQGLVTLDILRRCGEADSVLGFLDSDPAGSFVGREVNGHRVLGTIADLGEMRTQVGFAVPAVGNCQERQFIDEALLREGIAAPVVSHPSAVVSENAELAPGTVVCAGVVIGPEAEVGRACIINTGAIVEHHVSVGPYSMVAPNAAVAGCVTLGSRVWVGIGASVIDEVSIGDDVVVGAGAVVVDDVPNGTTVIGVPARPRQARNSDDREEHAR